MFTDSHLTGLKWTRKKVKDDTGMEIEVWEEHEHGSPYILFYSKREL